MSLLLYLIPVAVLMIQMESVVSSPVSGKVKRVLVVENDSIAQGDLVVEVTH
jgi:pyruvate carboxylase